MKNKRGVTLIELVIVISLIAIIVPMVVSPIIFSNKNFKRQNETTNIISDERAAMDYLTKEIRKNNGIDKIEGETNSQIKMKINSIEYKLENKTLFKGEKQIIEGIESLDINQDNNKVSIKLSIKDSKGNDYPLSSEIYIREGEVIK